MPRKSYPTQTHINDFCDLWQRTRFSGFTDLLLAEGWVASKPLTLRILTALKVDAPELAEDGGKYIVEPLMQTVKDVDPEIAERARQLLLNLQREDTREEMCRLVLEFNLTHAKEIALAAGYLPRDPQKRALFLFLTGQWDAYERLDIDQTLLASAYATADEALRKRLTKVGREAGRLEWVTAAIGGRQSRRVDEMSDTEWETARTVLLNRGAWSQVWRLAQLAPAYWSAKLMVDLAQAGWEPENAEERVGFVELVAMARMVADDLSEPLTRKVETLRGGQTVSRKAIATPDGRLLITRAGTQLDVYGVSSGTLLQSLSVGNHWQPEIALHPDGTRLAASGSQGAIRTWSLPDGNELKTLTGHHYGVQALAYGPGLLASGGRDKTLLVWDSVTGMKLGSLEGKTKSVDTLAVHPNGLMIVSGSGSNVQLWSWPDGHFLKALKSPNGQVTGLAFSSDGRWMASVGRNGGAAIWEVAGGKLKGIVGGPDHEGPSITALDPSLAFNTEGDILSARTSDKSVTFFSIPDGRLLKSLSFPHLPVVCPVTTGMLIAHGKQVSVLNGPRLSRLIGAGGLSPEELEWVGRLQHRSDLSPLEVKWLAFAAMFARWRKRFDIFLEEGRPPMLISEFDIVLER